MSLGKWVENMKASSLTIENFKTLIDKNAYYIDKTQLIVDCIKEERVLYTRPRRFGKTLNMSMLYYFFSNQESDNAYLFDGLKVTQYPEVMRHQNQYPTILISLKDMIGENLKIQTEMFASLIAAIVEKHSYLFESNALSDAQKKVLKKYQNKESSESDLRNALLNISTYLYKHYHQKVIILIDEYDVPLQAAYQNGYYNEMVNFLRSVFSSALKTNDALEKGILTGCLRISKESIFTGLNNFNVYSILEVDNEENFGFTESEVKQMLDDYHLGNDFNEVKKWYDGYLFGKKEIYNPWSTLKYVQSKMSDRDAKPASYWANTSGNAIVYNYIQNATPKLREEFEQLMQGKSIIKSIKQDLTYREMDDIDNIYSFLLLTGYLKVKSVIEETMPNNPEVPMIQYELVIPNLEIYQIYYEHFDKYFGQYQNHHRQELFDALVKGEEEKANDILNGVLERSISYYDNQESFYHGFLTGLFSDGYKVESNKESGNGRFDVCVLSKRLRKPAVIIECKHSITEKELVKDARVGAEQIVKKNYKQDIEERGYYPIVAYGISFYKKQCYVIKA